MDIARCSLAELVNDPLIALVMTSDRVDRCELKVLLERLVRNRLKDAGSIDPCRPQLLRTRTAP